MVPQRDIAPRVKLPLTTCLRSITSEGVMSMHTSRSAPCAVRMR